MVPQVSEPSVPAGGDTTARKRHAVDVPSYSSAPALVMLSRHRVVEFPLLGPLNINGGRLWLLCIVLIVGDLSVNPDSKCDSSNNGNT